MPKQHIQLASCEQRATISIYPNVLWPSPCHSLPFLQTRCSRRLCVSSCDGCIHGLPRLFRLRSPLPPSASRGLLHFRPSLSCLLLPSCFPSNSREAFPNGLHLPLLPPSSIHNCTISGIPPPSAVLIYQPLLFSLPHPQLVHVSIPPPYV